MSHPLLPFLDAARAKGAQDAFLVQLLKEAGWPESQIYRAFLERYAAETGVAIPPPIGSRAESAKDAFLYILSFIALGGWAIALGSMLFVFINRAFPDLLYGDYYSDETVTFQMATIIITLPLYLFITYALEKDLTERPEKTVSPVRNWLSSLVLLATAGTLIGDLITFLYWLLEGDTPLGFLLKVLVVFVIAGGIFLNYYRAFRKRRTQKS